MLFSITTFVAAAAMLNSISQAAYIMPPPPLAKRGPDNWVIQDCEFGGDYKGPYHPQEGTYVGSDSVRHDYFHDPDKGGKGYQKCWNDYYMVTQQEVPDPWYKSSGNSYCKSCMKEVATSRQTCDTRTHSISVDMSLKAWGKALEEVLSGKVGYTFADAHMECTTVTEALRCSWNTTADGDVCHTLWTQVVKLEQIGYKMKRCNNNDGKGDWTDCMSGWSQKKALNYLNQGCDSRCNATNYCGNVNGVNC